jgi:hypothetical protein
MLTKVKKKKPSIKITESTLNSLVQAVQKNLSNEDAQLLIRALNSDLARTQALKALKENSLFF